MACSLLHNEDRYEPAVHGGFRATSLSCNSQKLRSVLKPVLEKEKNHDKKQMVASYLVTNEKLAEGALG
jgi:hypothetical protein